MGVAARPVGIVGIGESKYYKRGTAPVPEFALTCEAVLRAADDAGLDVRLVDGFSSYGDDRTDPVRLAGALGLKDLAFANMVWGGGGGGVAAAVGNAAAAVASRTAKYVVVYRGLAQGTESRMGQSGGPYYDPRQWSYFEPYGLMAPAHLVALRMRRFIAEYGSGQMAMAAVALASYAHAQRNPRAVMYERPLTRDAYESARWICEPFRLFDCCQETDGAAAIILTSSDRAGDLPRPQVRLAGVAQGSAPRNSAADESNRDYATANFRSVASRLYDVSGFGPEDIDVVQAYENFTAGVVMSLVDHGFCAPDCVDEFMTEEAFRWDGGRLPLNTSGGNLAEAYVHGLELVNEAVRQLRGQSTSQVAGARTAMVIGGPGAAPVSSLILVKED